MASLDSVYGQTYREEANRDKTSHLLDLISTNVVNKNFSARMDSTHLWNGDSLKPEVLEALMQIIAKKNGNRFRLMRLRKGSQEMNALPYHIAGPVEYFAMIEMGQLTQIYTLYITPHQVEAY